MKGMLLLLLPLHSKCTDGGVPLEFFVISSSSQLDILLPVAVERRKREEARAGRQYPGVFLPPRRSGGREKERGGLWR